MFSAPRSSVLWIACAFLLSLPALAAAEDAEAPTAESAAPAAEGGAGVLPPEQATALWAKNCASCHGPDAKGKTKMGEILKVRDLTDPAVRATFDREKMTKAIKEGVKNEAGDKTVMRGFGDKLSEAEISALVDHLYALK